MAKGYGLDDRYSILSRNRRFFFLSKHPEWLGGSISLLTNECGGLFPWGQSGSGVKLTTYLHLVSSSIRVKLFLHSPTNLHGVMLN
jgi:hypothetical protein